MLKQRIRIKQFFIDFDRLRKGYVGEAGVFNSLYHEQITYVLFDFSSEHVLEHSTLSLQKKRFSN